MPLGHHRELHTRLGAEVAFTEGFGATAGFVRQVQPGVVAGIGKFADLETLDTLPDLTLISDTLGLFPKRAVGNSRTVIAPDRTEVVLDCARLHISQVQFMASVHGLCAELVAVAEISQLQDPTAESLSIEADAVDSRH